MKEKEEVEEVEGASQEPKITETQSGYGAALCFHWLLNTFYALTSYTNIEISEWKYFRPDPRAVLYMEGDGTQDGWPLHVSPREGGLKFHPVLSVSKLSHQLFTKGGGRGVFEGGEQSIWAQSFSLQYHCSDLFANSNTQALIKTKAVLFRQL